MNICGELNRICAKEFRKREGGKECRNPVNAKLDTRSVCELE